MSEQTPRPDAAPLDPAAGATIAGETAAAPLHEPPPETAPEPPPQWHAHPPQRSRSALAVLSALGFVLLLAGLGFEWFQEQQLEQQLADVARNAVSLSSVAPSVAPARVAALEAQVKTLEQRLAAAQKQSAAGGADLGPLEARIAALESRKTDGGADPALAARLDSVAADAAAAKLAETTMAGRIGDLEGRLKDAEKQQAALAERATQMRRIEQAQVALEAGEPLGDLPGAPAALARFAHAKPPTEAALRLTFPAAADAAVAASRPSVEGKTIGERIWLHARSLVTVKQGDKVVIGPPSAAVLGEAQAKLDAGDLGGALSALDALDAAAASAIAAWRAQAQALLDARAALVMTGKS